MVTFLGFATVILLGHFGWWLFCYNRLNAMAWPRKHIKRLERVIVLISLILPLVCWLIDGHRIPLASWQSEPLVSLLSGVGPVFSIWAVGSMVSFVALTPGWLESRLWLRPPHNLTQHAQAVYRVEEHCEKPVTASWLSKTCNRLPGNEITRLSVTTKTLVLEPTRVRSWESLRIGHLSDLHFTGQLAQHYYEFAFERLLELSPDIIIVTGDLIDKDHCLDWLEEVLGHLHAPLGRYFIIGNHEQRLSNLAVAIDRLVASGWNDLGVRDILVEPLKNGQPRIRLIGNEQPWYERHAGERFGQPDVTHRNAPTELWLGVAHTPDQYRWARRLGLDLLIAGHTHGGQIRLPGIGPIVAPSWHGSRFASGVFRLPPTLMHVSRGLAGCHPLRWRCLPEVTLLEIQSKPARQVVPVQ